MHTLGRYRGAFLTTGLALCLSLPIKAQERVEKASYQECVEKGIALLKQDSLLQAEPCFLQAIKAEPTQKSNGLLYNYIGQIQERTGRTKEAISSYGNAILLNPDNTEFLLNRASLYLSLENNDRAQQDYTTVIDHDPKNQEALFFRAYIFSTKRMYREARTDYEALLQLNPNHEKALLGMVLLNDKTGRPKEAMDQLNQLVRIFPTNALYRTIRGGIHQKNKNYELAIKDFTQAVTLELGNPEHLISRASCYMEMKKRKNATADLKQAQALGGDPIVIASMLQKKK